MRFAAAAAANSCVKVWGVATMSEDRALMGNTDARVRKKSVWHLQEKQGNEFYYL